MELCAIPSIEALDINSLIIQYVDPDMPCLSSSENRIYSSQISTLIKNKLNGICTNEFFDESVVLVADLMCDNISKYAAFRHIENVTVCIETGECLIKGLRYGY